MRLYRVYIDEVGNHDLVHADDPNERYLSLTGVLLESAHTLRVVQPEMDQIKRDFFQRDPDHPIVFHRKDIVNKRGDFVALRDPEVEARFNTTLLELLDRWDYSVITVVIDKKAHREKYRVWQYHPYHYCLAVLLERFIRFLQAGGDRGDVMAESRGGVEDRRLMASYTQLYDDGNENLEATLWQTHLTSRELKVKPKSANIAGLQIADLLAHPSRREILREKHLVSDDRDTFGDRISQILRLGKYRRSAGGAIWGFGKKLLPLRTKKKGALSGASPMAYGHPPPLYGLVQLYNRSARNAIAATPRTHRSAGSQSGAAIRTRTEFTLYQPIRTLEFIGLGIQGQARGKAPAGRRMPRSWPATSWLGQ